jgi:cytidylate kinase
MTPIISRHQPRLTIAVDGPAAAGKGTLARRLATHFKLPYLDTGLLYRAVSSSVLHHGVSPIDAANSLVDALTLSLANLSDPILRQQDVGATASMISALPAVRAALLAFQRHFAEQPQGAVLDGRDIGSIVYPDATVKLFITASLEVRAERRLKELQENEQPVIYAEVLADLKDRDRRDSYRTVCPLMWSGDACYLDTSSLSADQAFAKALEFVERKLLLLEAERLV